MRHNAVRIIAETARGASNDVSWKIVLDAVVDGSVMKKQLCFGFASNDDEGPTKRWPFTMRPEGANWVLDYGADSEEPLQPTNLVDREIRLGEYFTIWDGTDEITMRITQINEL